MQNYVFSQNYAIVIIQSSNKTRTRYIFQCSRYDVKNKNIKKLTKKNKQRSNIKHQFFDCFYKVRLVYYKKTKKWIIILKKTKHNHSSLDNFFEHKRAHKNKNSNKTKTKRFDKKLKKFNTKYKQINKTFRCHKLRLSKIKYQNLMRKMQKRISNEKFRYVLQMLENKNFHIRIQKQWYYNNNEKTHKKIQFFWFCNKKQIKLTRWFENETCIIIDTTFNTNDLLLFLSMLMIVTNIDINFFIAYCFVISKSIETFLFLYDCIKNLLFHDKCFDFVVLLNDFVVKLIVSMIKKRQVKIKSMKKRKQILVNIVEKTISMTYKIQIQMFETNNDCKLQCYTWHVVQTIKKKLINESYSIVLRERHINRV